MKTINLRDYYSYYTVDMFIDVPDEIAVALLKSKRQENAYRRRLYRHKAQYSLDRDDGIEHDICFTSLSPCEVYEHKIAIEQLYAAIANLPDKQGKRIYAHYILGMSKAQIARTEGVSKSRISESIERGLQNIKVLLENML